MNCIICGKDTNSGSPHCASCMTILFSTVNLGHYPATALHRDLHQLVDDIASCAENPWSWPVTPEQQLYFVRSFIGRAVRLEARDDYRSEAVALAVEGVKEANK